MYCFLPVIWTLDTQSGFAYVLQGIDHIYYVDVVDWL